MPVINQIAKFQSVIDVPVKTVVSTYVPRSYGANTGFQVGNPWPIYSHARNNLFGVGNPSTLGFYCDVFSLDAAGVGHFSLNTFGDQVGGNSVGLFSPGWWNGRLVGFDGGGRTIVSPVGFFNFISGYDFAAPVGANITSASMPPMASLYTLGVSGVLNTIPDYQGGPVLMPTLGRFGMFFFNGGPDNVVLSNPFAIGLHVLPAPPSNPVFWGTVPGSGFYLAQSATLNLSQLPFDGSRIDYLTSWDTAALQTQMAISGFSDFALSSTTSVVGYVTFIKGTAIAFAGKSYINFAVLTNPTGLKYWILNLIPQDATAIDALAFPGVGSASVLVDPNGVVWVSSTRQPAAVLASGLNALAGSTAFLLPIFPPTPLPPRSPNAYILARNQHANSPNERRANNP